VKRDPSDGYPVEVIYKVTPTVYTLILNSNPPNFPYPAGIYTLISEGTGKLELHFDCGNHWINSPANYSFSVTTPTSAGIQVIISESIISDHVRNIRVIMPGFLNKYKTQPYNPTYLQDISGFSALRFMDFSRTNDNNLAYWSDRALPNTAKEHSASYFTFPILSISYYSKKTKFTGKYAALVTVDTSKTLGPLATGQQVDITGSDASVNFTSNLNVKGFQSLNLAAWQTNIEVISPNSFLISFNQWWWNSGFNVTLFKNGTSRGNVLLTIRHGSSLETIIDIANVQNASPWLNIPTMANDDFVRQYARIVRDKLNPLLPAYIEYSNELWNTMFHSSTYAAAMSLALNLKNSAEFVALRSLQIFNIFLQEFGTAAMKKRIVKVIGAQAAGGGSTLLAAANNPLLNPNNIAIDALSIAPYFGIGVSSYITANNLLGKITLDEAVDLARAAVEADTRLYTRNNAAIAKTYNVTLIAYEMGQHLVGIGADQNNNQLTDLLMNINRNSRMKGIYDNMIRAWSEEGGKLFCAFLSTAWYSKYGSWGFKEYQLQSAKTAPKYVSLKSAVARYQAANVVA
jgi:hypothetical protein